VRIRPLLARICATDPADRAICPPFLLEFDVVHERPDRDVRTVGVSGLDVGAGARKNVSPTEFRSDRGCTASPVRVVQQREARGPVRSYSIAATVAGKSFLFL